jgi:nuclear GTP-binding protein
LTTHYFLKRQGGIPDLENTARSVLQDWNSGRIPFYTIPPASGVAVESHVESSIVQSWGKEFQISDIVAMEQSHVLPSVRSKSQTSHSLLAMQSGSETTCVDFEGLPEAQEDELDDQDEGDEMYFFFVVYDSFFLANIFIISTFIG